MSTEVWVRNPHNYIRECVEGDQYLIAWDRGQLVKAKIDPIKHADLYYGKAYDWRALAIGIQGAAEYRDGDELMKPSAVYPVWEYGEDMGLLEEFMQSNIGDDAALCGDFALPGDERPVLGQEHRVVITNIPDARSGPGRSFLTKVKELQEDYPEVILHLHGLYSFRAMFSSGARSVDIDARTEASKGDVVLPMGKKIKYEMAGLYPNWVRILGFKPIDLAIPRNRCIFHMKSARWAGENWDSLGNVPIRMSHLPDDHTSSDEEFVPKTTASRLTSFAPVKEGDKFACNTCSLSDKCTHYREGAVCSVPGSEPKELALFFKSRDSNTIIEGLGILAAANARRLERGMKAEDALGDIDKNVTAVMGQVFDQGQKLAKLVDPSLRGGAKVQVNVGSAGIIAATSPRQMVAEAFRQLEMQGIKREDITPGMIQGLLEGMSSPDQAQRSFEAPVDNTGHQVIEVTDGSE